MIWFTSDTHYNHKNLIAGLSEWENKQGCRDFPDLDSHNAALCNNINAAVAPDDTLYVLGDWSFGGFKQIARFRERIMCEDIRLVLGNHDHHIRSNRKNCQELFTSVEEATQIVVEGQIINLFHYSCRVWDKSYRGAWMLYGHSHGSLPQYTNKTASPQWIGDDYMVRSYKTMDVGMDTHPEFRPWSFDELKEIMDKRDVLLDVDHHGATTN